MTARTIDVLVVGGGATGTAVLRDLALRGIPALLAERSDLGTGASGRNHGLLHSGARYVSQDPLSARECALESDVVRRIAMPAVEDTGGLFVSLSSDPPEYPAAFTAACRLAGVPCVEVTSPDARRIEPALPTTVSRAFRVRDASIDPWLLIDLTARNAAAHGGVVLPYTRLMGFDVERGRIVRARIADMRTGSTETVAPGFVVNAGGPWAGEIAGMAGAGVRLVRGRGTMLIFARRVVDTVINRCRMPGDGDLLVPVHTVSILGTTSDVVDDADATRVTADEVASLFRLGQEFLPGLAYARILRAYAGTRPLYDPRPEELRPEELLTNGQDRAATVAGQAPTDSRRVSRTHRVLDHGPRDGIANMVTIVGGKLTTHRLMAEHAVDAVARGLGVSAPCRTTEIGLAPARTAHPYWLGHRLEEREARGGGSADLVCECELVSRRDVLRYLDARPMVSLDDLRRATRLGMGPCQGLFCAFRAASLVAARAIRDLAEGSPVRDRERRSTEAARLVAAAGPSPVEPGRTRLHSDPSIRDRGQSFGAAITDAALLGFLGERAEGIIPIAWGSQLQQVQFQRGVLLGVMGIDSLVEGALTVGGHHDEP